jgi:predicted nucleotidyltransferase
MSVEEIKQKVSPILLKYNVKRASVFGSIAKQTDTPTSDVDILVELDDSISLLDVIGIKLEIEDILNRNVDLVEFDAVKPALKEFILNNQIPIYG